jgi:PAS domain S-box-containing protein
MADFLQILVADDDAEDRLAVARALESSGVSAELTEVSSGREAIEHLRGGRFDCALIDNSLPDREGLPLLADLFASGVTTPIIIMSDQGSEELAVDLMKAGAVDYLSKNRVSLDHLARSVRSAVRLYRSESARRAAEHDLLDRSAQLHGLARAAIAINAAGPVERTLETIVEQARSIIGAHQGVAGIFPGLKRARAVAAVSMSEKYAAWHDYERRADGPGIYAAIFRENKPLRMTQAQLESDPDWQAFEKGTPHPPMRGCLAAPLIARDGRNLGIVQLSDKYEGDFTESDEAILVQLAQLASVAIENSRLYEAVRSGEEQYRFLAESIPQIVFTAGPHGAIDYCNRGWTQYAGQTFERARGSGWEEAIHPNDLSRMRQSWRAAAESAAPLEVEVRFRRAADGMNRWHLLRASPMCDADGRVLRWFGTATDIHDWKRVQEDLRIQRERLDLVLEASELGLWYCDLPFNELVWNNKTREHFHLPRNVPVTMEAFYARIHPQDRERTRQAVEQAISRNERYDVDYRTVSPDGTQVSWIRAIGRCFADPAGKPVRFDGITVDISSQKQAEQTLREAKDSAEAANASKDRFLAALSHELRTPLMPVLTTVQLLENGVGRSAQIREGLDVIRRNIELEARLIDDLLDLTRVSKGKLQLNYDTVDLHHVITSSLDICSADIEAKNLKVKLDLPAGHHHVRGDAARLQQVFWNLIKNAVKFTPRGGSITVHSMDVPPVNGAGGMLRVLVRDSGIGMAPEVLDRIFDAFEQADQSVTRQFGGLGLGLAISKALIGLHGGNLSAGSAGLGRGSTFTVELQTVPAPPSLPARDRDGMGRARRSGPPQSAARDGAAQVDGARRTSGTNRTSSANRAAGAGRAGSAPRRPRPPAVRILLVDDHQDTNRAMARLLSRMGYDVQTAESMQSALATAEAARAASGAGKAKPFDLLISDIGLPDGSGLELMRQLVQHQPIKGIALSGYGMEEDVRRSKEAGFYEHLTKPINFKRLEAAIRTLAAATPQLTSETAKP